MNTYNIKVSVSIRMMSIKKVLMQFLFFTCFFKGFLCEKGWRYVIWLIKMLGRNYVIENFMIQRALTSLQLYFRMMNLLEKQNALRNKEVFHERNGIITKRKITITKNCKEK